MRFLKVIQDGIQQLLITGTGLNEAKSLEDFCKIIFCLKKNFCALELLQNHTFFENVYDFTLKCLEICKITFFTYI